ncbi:MAG TPA: TauD/TfdA family dioxygenase, partial [Arenicellales bacterium]|nr:TauD/TfdA family dioxygenase [Arenicellales bacterium]
MHDRPLPLVAEIPAERSERDAVTWATDHAGALRTLVRSKGAVLIRGFGITTPEAFRAVCQAIEPDLQPYTGGDSPRSGVADKVYTSTEYDAGLEVLLHNELSYAGWSPGVVFFGCLVPALEGGETHIADGREIYQALPADIVEQFESRGVAYLQHLWDAEGEPGIGKSWQETFETTDRRAVEAYLERSGMSWEWTGFGLRTRAPQAAVVSHPVTGEKCWWNQADQWHRALASVKTSFGGDGDPRFDPATAGEETLGNHVTFGDGGEIDPSDLETIRAVSRSVEIAFPWQAGDIMVLDNILVMHGRKPYRGPRRILVA